MKVPTNPIVMGLAVILIYSIFLSIIAFGVLYYKNLAEIAKTQQIACPLAKYCKAGTSSTGYTSTVSLTFPVSYSDYGEETISLPYYDSYSNPTQKTLTITFDNTTTSLPGGATSYLGLTGVGWGGISPDYTVYINGLSSYSDLSSIIPALLTQMLTSGDSPVRKQGFMEINNLTQDSQPYLHYRIKVFTKSEDYSSLSVSSDNSNSVLLSGTNTVDFLPTDLVNPGHYVNVYDNMNYLNKNQVSKSLDPNNSDAIENFSWCVDPSFVPESCDGLALNNDGQWVDADSDPSSTVRYIWQDWAVFGDNDVEAVPFCSFNLDKTIDYSGRRTNSAAGTGGVGSYQMNRLATDIVDNTLQNPSSTPLTYTQGADGSQVNGIDNTYAQNLIFCGGNASTDDNLSGVNTIGTTPYEAKYPNKAAITNNYTNIGF